MDQCRARRNALPVAKCIRTGKAIRCGAEQIFRVAPEVAVSPIRLDNWVRAKDELPNQAVNAAAQIGDDLSRLFLGRNAQKC